MPTITLLPCPFCGTKVTTKDILPQPSPSPLYPDAECYLIRCWQCGASVFEQTKFKCQIAARWNHRVNVSAATVHTGAALPDPSADEIARCKEIFSRFSDDTVRQINTVYPIHVMHQGGSHGWYITMLQRIACGMGILHCESKMTME